MILRALSLALWVHLGAISGCTPAATAGDERDPRFRQALAALDAPATGPATGQRTGPVLYFLGAALHPEDWSRNDVVGLAEALRNGASRMTLRAVILSNDQPPPHSLAALITRAPYPLADAANIAEAAEAIAAHMRDGDRALVFFSGHGGPGALGVTVPGEDEDELDARFLREMLAPLAGHDTVVVVSACYSGSLIPALLAPDRVVMTAARRDRSSFGCAADQTDTVYGAAAIRRFGEAGHSLREIARAIAADVAREERARDYGPPSLPQFTAGPGSLALLDAPIF